VGQLDAIVRCQNFGYSGPCSSRRALHRVQTPPVVLRYRHGSVARNAATAACLPAVAATELEVAAAETEVAFRSGEFARWFAALRDCWIEGQVALKDQVRFLMRARAGCTSLSSVIAERARWWLIDLAAGVVVGCAMPTGSLARIVISTDYGRTSCVESFLLPSWC
jgi:hypothetical protein